MSCRLVGMMNKKYTIMTAVKHVRKKNLIVIKQSFIECLVFIAE